MRRIIIFCVFLLIYLSATLQVLAQSNTIEADVSKTSLQLNETFTYTITCQVTEETSYINPVITPPDLSSFKQQSIQTSSVIQQYAIQKITVITQAYQLTPTKEGRFRIQPAKLEYVNPITGQKETKQSKEFTITVGNANMFSIPWKELKIIATVVGYTLLVIGVCAGIIYVLYRLALLFDQAAKRQPLPKQTDLYALPTPKTISYDKAFREIRRLLEENRIEEAYEQMSFMLRLFITNKHKIPALKRTTREIAEALKNNNIPKSDEIEECLVQFDLVKFAKIIPSTNETEVLLGRLMKIVK